MPYFAKPDPAIVLQIRNDRISVHFTPQNKKHPFSVWLDGRPTSTHPDSIEAARNADFLATLYAQYQQGIR